MPDFLAEQLTRAENYDWRLRLRTAIRNRRKPSALMLERKHKLNKDDLHRFDQLFMMAEQVLKDETCSTCGLPFWISHSTDSNIEFYQEVDTCQSCAEHERLNEARKKLKEEDGPGITRFIQARHVDHESGERLPGRREYQAERYAEVMAEIERKKQVRGDGS